MQISPCGVIFFQRLDGTSGTLFFKPLQDCNQNYREDGPQEIYPRLTFEQLGERIGLSKRAVSKIFSERDESGKPAYKELVIMWEILGSKEQILKYGMKHLQNKQKGR